MVVSGYRIPASWLYQDEEDDAGYLYHGRIWMKGMMEDTCIMVVSG